MKHLPSATRTCRVVLCALALMALLWPASRAAAQGATTGAVTGVVTNDQQQPVAGASIIAIHLPSGTTYETTTRADGRYSILGMRVGGPYSITVAYVQGGGAAFQPKTEDNISVNLGVATEVPISVQGISVQEKVEVVATVDPVFASTRTGAADRKSTRLNSSHSQQSRMPSSA